jgi:hypothetical protein
MSFERMINKEHSPTEEEILTAIGRTREWHHLRKFLKDNYDFAPELVYYGKKYGWTIRYRRSGKTLCSLFPEKGAFTVLVVLGNKEVSGIQTVSNKFSHKVKSLIENTEHLHDGCWLWINVSNMREVRDIIELLKLKGKQKGAKVTRQ